MKKILLLMSGLILLCPAVRAEAPPVKVAFSPDGGAETLVLSVIDSARAEIRVAGYSFTSPEVARSLIRAKARGVDVLVVLDERANQSRKSQAAIGLLAGGDIPVRLNGRFEALHDKFIVADRQTVETGSFNYTRAAAHMNSENAMVISSAPEVASQYLQHWNARWSEGTDYTLPY